MSQIRYEDQIKIIRNFFSRCETVEERKKVFKGFVAEKDFSRSAIWQAMKDLRISINFKIGQFVPSDIDLEKIRFEPD